MTPEELDIIRREMIPDISDTQLAMFVKTCEATGLDPFKRQIYGRLQNSREKDRNGREFWVKKLVTITSIEGFRSIAERTGQYRGQDDILWCGEDGVWRDVWLAQDPPFASKCGVYREGFVKALSRVARFDAYEDEKSPVWKKMPELMISKCAEALALRAAFPNELGGLYTADEMAQALKDAEPASAAADSERNRQIGRAALDKLSAAANGSAQDKAALADALDSATPEERKALQDLANAAVEADRKTSDTNAHVSDDGMPHHPECDLIPRYSGRDTLPEKTSKNYVIEKLREVRYSQLSAHQLAELIVHYEKKWPEINGPHKHQVMLHVEHARRLMESLLHIERKNGAAA